jgi:23S rRNA (adenine2030-N6)-methyltransferase
MAILFPEILPISLGNHEYYLGTDSSRQVTVLLYQNRLNLDSANAAKLQGWLQQKLQKEYVDLVQLCNAKGHWDLYPGSPEIIRRSIRPDDRMRLFELHPTDFDILEEHFDKSKVAKVFKGDGFDGLKALLPPPTRRAVIFMDPPYEIKSDYQRVVASVAEGLRRFAEGVYIVWYPILTRGDHISLIEELNALSDKTLNISMTVQEPDEQGFGMLGSGLFIINPPWTLAENMKSVMPYLTEKLAQYPRASYELDSK